MTLRWVEFTVKGDSGTFWTTFQPALTTQMILDQNEVVSDVQHYESLIKAATSAQTLHVEICSSVLFLKDNSV